MHRGLGLGPCFHKDMGTPVEYIPAPFFPHKLSPAERNNNIRNRKLLTVKAVLEELSWLEGARHVFTILTDHKNLEYIRRVKHLNSWQARWELFFSRFDLKITYQPGSKDGKADALL